MLEFKLRRRLSRRIWGSQHRGSIFDLVLALQFVEDCRQALAVKL